MTSDTPLAESPRAPRFLLDRAALDGLLAALRGEGFRTVGPRVEGDAIVFADVHDSADFPEGKTALQAPGSFRVVPRKDRALFGFAVGPSSLRPYVFAPRVRLVQLRRRGGSFEATPDDTPPPKVAVFGLRACDLAALATQDRVFLAGLGHDPDYAARRAGLFLVAVQCAEPGGTCFCTSMGTGPKAERGFDLALTELLEGAHRFVVEVGSDAGADLARRLRWPTADETDVTRAETVSESARAAITKHLDTDGLPALLTRNALHPRFQDAGSRCLSCTSCTLVCPTCFCSTVEDTTDLTGDVAERWRRWDSCFTLEHSYVHGGPVRPSTAARYRQWLTHKLATWHDQFGTSGCVGCGRCVTWCPASIDITEEVAAIRATDGEVHSG